MSCRLPEESSVQLVSEKKMGSVRPVVSLNFGHVLEGIAVHRVIPARQVEWEKGFVDQRVKPKVDFGLLLVITAAQNLLAES